MMKYVFTHMGKTHLKWLEIIEPVICHLYLSKKEKKESQLIIFKKQKYLYLMHTELEVVSVLKNQTEKPHN